jgi:hypothetical protein
MQRLFNSMHHSPSHKQLYYVTVLQQKCSKPRNFRVVIKLPDVGTGFVGFVPPVRQSVKKTPLRKNALSPVLYRKGSGRGSCSTATY